MSKTLVIYISVFHGNTKKLLEMANKYLAIDMIPVEEASKCNLEDYDCVGMASGIYMSKPHEQIMSYMETHVSKLHSKKVFLVLTSGSASKKAIKIVTEQMKEKGLNIEKTYRCKGFDTYGAFKLVGGINKNHPNEEDAKQLVKFLDSMR